MLSAFVALQSENFIRPIFQRNECKKQESSRSTKFSTWGQQSQRYHCEYATAHLRKLMQDCFEHLKREWFRSDTP